jgi:hypothetical protein
MVVEIIVVIAASINLIAVGVWATRKQQRVTITQMPVIQPMTEDYLSDILDVLHSIEERLNK